MICVYSDGSATSHDLPGGYGVVITMNGEQIVEFNGSLENATNNEAELSGAIAGLQYVVDHLDISEEIVLVSDSQLVLGYANGSYRCKAMHLTPLYIKLRKLYQQLNAETRWVRGHNGEPFNERCDKLAKSARETQLAKKNKK